MRNAFDTMTREELLVVVLKQDRLLNHMKYCGRCKDYRPVSLFSKNRSAADGLQGRCKECDKEFGAKWRKENAEYIKQAKEAKRQLKQEQKK